MIVPAFAVVPPMSNESTFATPIAAPTAAAAITPLAGPLSTSVAGRSATNDNAAVPPLDCITNTGAVMPSARTPLASRSR